MLEEAPAFRWDVLEFEAAWIKPPCIHSAIFCSMTWRMVATSSGSRVRFSVESHQRVTTGMPSAAHHVRTSSVFSDARRYPSLGSDKPVSRA